MEFDELTVQMSDCVMAAINKEIDVRGDQLTALKSRIRAAMKEGNDDE